MATMERNGSGEGHEQEGLLLDPSCTRSGINDMQDGLVRSCICDVSCIGK